MHKGTKTVQLRSKGVSDNVCKNNHVTFSHGIPNYKQSQDLSFMQAPSYVSPGIHGKSQGKWKDFEVGRLIFCLWEIHERGVEDN